MQTSDFIFLIIAPKNLEIMLNVKKLIAPFKRKIKVNAIKRLSVLISIFKILKIELVASTSSPLPSKKPISESSV